MTTSAISEKDLATLQATKWAARLAALAAVLSAALSLVGALYQGSSENSRAVREHRSTVYSAVLGATSKFASSVPGAQAAAQGSSRATNEDWAEMKASYNELADASAYVRIMGSDKAINQSEALLARATEIRDKLVSLNDAPGPTAVQIAKEVDASVSEFPAVEEQYEEAARADLVPETWLSRLRPH